MMTDSELAQELALRSTEGLWWLAQQIMDEAGPTGEIDAGHLHLVSACLAELGHRDPELFGTQEFDDFRELVAEKLAAMPKVGHA